MNDCASQETMNLVLGALTAVLVVLQQIFSYYRHQHIMSDNKRLLHVIEGSTGSVDGVK